jgi:uncharacterized membrane protein YoaK (UPF0700 family)
MGEGPERSGGMYRALTGALLALTVSTGVIDAVSFLGLGKVFVANMTGNVIFLGFALAGEPGLSVPASLTALASFVVGALAGGRLAARWGHHRGRHLGAAATVTVVPMLAAVALSAAAPLHTGVRYGLIVLLAVAFGVQVSTARKLSVPDLPTTVLTMTLTGLVSESRLAGGAGPNIRVRLASIAALLAGALLGAVLVLHVSILAGLALATALVGGVAVTVSRLAVRSDATAWRAPTAATPAGTTDRPAATGEPPGPPPTST